MEVDELPPPFDAITVNVYDVLYVNPDTTIGLDEPDAVIPLDEVTI